MIKSIIFDYDGLLVDTDHLWFQSCKELCKEFGVSIPESDREDLMRGNLSEYLVQKYNLPTTKETLRPKLNAIFDKLTINGVQPLPGAINLVKKLSKLYPLAVASGTRTERLSASLKTLGIYKNFTFIIGNDQVKNGKPSPEIYLKAAKMLQVDPHECLVFEDQLKGLTAAKAANMYCVVIPNRDFKKTQYSEADRTIKSLTLVKLEDIQLIGQKN